VLFEQIIFFGAALLAIAGALGVVVLQNPFYSVLSLVVHLIALAVLFLLLSAEFLAAAQVVVYAGAVMVLYLFVTAYVGGSDEPLRAEQGAVARIGPLFAGVLFVELTIAIVGSSLQLLDSGGAELEAGFGTPGRIGELLLGQFLVAFEAASYLLLITAVGALVLAGRRRGLEPPPDDRDPDSDPRAATSLGAPGEPRSSAGG
jgi:NADH:ubiquinone oxidoreductase subunit 6 (subunit J)